MISCDFAPNESWDDAFLSLKLLFQPWRWKKGKEINFIKKEILEKVLNFGWQKWNGSRQGEATTFLGTGTDERKTRNRIQNFQISLFLSGRSALYFLLQSLNLPKNSEVIVQGFTCEAVILPILANNLKPVYVDIEKSTFSINPIDLEKKISPKTKVLILQHTFGVTPKHRNKILSIVKQHNLLLIEDIAHGYNNLEFRIQHSELIYLLSFGRGKALSSVFGGAIVTNNKEIAKRLNKIEAVLPFPSYWHLFKLLLYKPLAMIIKSTYDFGLGKFFHKIFNFFNLLLPEITHKEKRGEYNHFFDKNYPNALAILLLHQLRKFPQIQKQRKKIVNFYLENLKKIVLNYQLPITHYSLIRFPLLINHRDEVIKKAKKQNIFLGQWYNQVVAPKGLPLSQVGYKIGDCPTAEGICQKIINLPTNINLIQAKRVVELLKTLNDV